MQQSKKPLWKKSMLQTLNLDDIREFLDEISENGEMYGYDRDEDGYYQDYKDLFDGMAGSAYNLWEVLQGYEGSDLDEYWDLMTVALLGKTHKVLGYDVMQEDYYGMLSHEEDWAEDTAAAKLEKMTKRELISRFRKVLVVLVSFLDIKAAHDSLTAIVDELDERAALLSRKNNEIDRVYQDLTGKDGDEFDRLVANLPQRMWVE